jgi:sterol-4alpha-carboxylate 3-dehydrogenase (decarboxylating)
MMNYLMGRIGISMAFLGFKAYEKWEDTIDDLVGNACSVVTHFVQGQKSSRQKHADN